MYFRFNQETLKFEAYPQYGKTRPITPQAITMLLWNRRSDEMRRAMVEAVLRVNALAPKYAPLPRINDNLPLLAIVGNKPVSLYPLDDGMYYSPELGRRVATNAAYMLLYNSPNKVSSSKPVRKSRAERRADERSGVFNGRGTVYYNPQFWTEVAQ